jgi:hypothetical protein
MQCAVLPGAGGMTFLFFRLYCRRRETVSIFEHPTPRARGATMATLPSIEPDPGPRLTLELWAVIAAFVVVILIIASTWPGLA